MRTKVCIITTVHQPFDTRIFHKEAKTLVKAGHEVTLIAQHEGNTVLEWISVIDLPKPRTRLYGIFCLTLRAFYLALHQRADFYHFHDPEMLIFGLLLKLFTRAKVIYDVHEDVPEQIFIKQWIPTPLRHLVARLFNFIEKLLARKLEAVVVATEGIAEKFKGFKAVIIHNYPDLNMLPYPFNNYIKMKTRFLFMLAV